MADGTHAEAIHREPSARALKVSGYTPKISAMTDIFVPRMEIFPTARSKKQIETRVPGIRVETRPEAAQERAHERARQERLAREARQRVRIERLRSEAAYAREVARMEQDEARIKEQAALAVAVLGILGTFGAVSVAILEGKAILASLVSALEGFLAAAPSVLFEVVRGVLATLASGDPTFTAAAALISFSLLFAGLNAMVADARVRRQRKEYGY